MIVVCFPTRKIMVVGKEIQHLLIFVIYRAELQMFAYFQNQNAFRHSIKLSNNLQINALRSKNSLKDICGFVNVFLQTQFEDISGHLPWTVKYIKGPQIKSWRPWLSTCNIVYFLQQFRLPWSSKRVCFWLTGDPYLRILVNTQLHCGWSDIHMKCTARRLTCFQKNLPGSLRTFSSPYKSHVLLGTRTNSSRLMRINTTTRILTDRRAFTAQMRKVPGKQHFSSVVSKLNENCIKPGSDLVSNSGSKFTIPEYTPGH